MTKNFNNKDNRFNQHMRSLRGGYHENYRFQSDYNVFKATHIYTYKPLFETDDLNEAGDKEEEFIRRYNTTNPQYGFNLSTGGLANKGYKQSDHAKKIASQTHSKKTGNLNPFYGKNHTDQTKEMISSKNKGRLKGIPKSNSTKEKMARNNAKSKSVSVDGVIYRSCTYASEIIGICRKKIAKMASDPNIPNVFFVNKN